MSADPAAERLADLVDLRELLWLSIRGTDSSRDVAALSRQLTDVIAQISELKKQAGPKKGTPLDEFTSKLRAREAGAGVRDGAVGS